MPSLIAIGIFVYGFISWTGYVSLSNWNSLVKDLSFAGLKNFAFLFQDFRFQSDIRNTIMFTVLFIFACLAIGLLLAMLVNSKIKGEGFFATFSFFRWPFPLS